MTTNTNFMYKAGRIEAEAIAARIRKDKAPRTGVPTKAGHTWVEDKSVKDGGYFRKLRPGQQDPNSSHRHAVKGEVTGTISTGIGAAAIVAGAAAYAAIVSRQQETDPRAGVLQAAKIGVPVAAAAGVLGIAGIVHADLVSSEISSEEVEKNGAPVVPADGLSEEGYARLNELEPGDLIRRAYPSGKKNWRYHYGIYAGEKDGDHMIYHMSDAAGPGGSDDQVPKVRFSKIVGSGSPGVTEYRKVPDEEMYKTPGVRKIPKEEVLSRAKSVVGTVFSYEGFDSNCEVFARGIVEGDAYGLQGQNITPITRRIAAMSDLFLSLTRPERYGIYFNNPNKKSAKEIVRQLSEERPELSDSFRLTLATTKGKKDSRLKTIPEHFAMTDAIVKLFGSKPAKKVVEKELNKNYIMVVAGTASRSDDTASRSDDTASRSDDTASRSDDTASMYQAGKREGKAIAARIRKDKAPRTGVPTKAGHTWVEDKTVKGGGYFRKLTLGKKDTPKVGGGTTGKAFLAGLGSAALATGAIAGVKALHSQAEAAAKVAADDARAKRVAAGVAAVVGAGVASGAVAGVVSGAGAGRIAHKERKGDELGRDKIQNIEIVLREGGYTKEVDEENNIAHWRSPSGLSMTSLGHVGGTSFFARNVKEWGASEYSMKFSINTLGQGAITPKDKEQLLDKMKKSLSHQISVTPDGSEIEIKDLLSGADDPELDITKEERNKVYRGLGFHADMSGRVKGGKIAASDNLDSIYWQARADAVKARTGVPTKPGYTWVADKRAAKGGYFRKLRPGQQDPNTIKGANGQPQPGGGQRPTAKPPAPAPGQQQQQQPKVPSKQPAAAKSGGGGGALAGAGLATALTAAIAAGGAAALQQQQQQQQQQQETADKVKKLTGGSAAIIAGALTATQLSPEGIERNHALINTGLETAATKYNGVQLDGLIERLPIEDELKVKAKNLVGKSKIAVASKVMTAIGYKLDAIDEKNNLSHWTGPNNGASYSMGSAGSHSFLMATRRTTDNAAKGKPNAYETLFTVDFGLNQQKVSSAEGKKIISMTKAAFANHAAKLPDGSFLGVEAYTKDGKGDARSNLYQKFGFRPAKTGGLWAKIEGGKIVGSEKKDRVKVKPTQEAKEDSMSLDDAILLYLYGEDRFDAYIEAREDALRRVNVPAKGDRDAYSYTREAGASVNVRQELKQPNRAHRLSGNNFVNQIDFMKIKIDPNAIAKAEAARAGGAHAHPVWPMTVGDLPYLYKPVDMGMETANSTTRKEGANEVLLSAMARVAGIPSQFARLVPKSLDNMRPDLSAPGVAIEKIPKSRTLLDDEPHVPNPDTYLPMTDANMAPRRYFRKMLTHPDLAKIAALDTFAMNIDRHGGNIMVTNDETGSPRYGGKRYHAIDNGAAYEPVMGGSPHDILAKEILNMGDQYKDDRVRKENFKLYVNTLRYLSNEYPVAKIQAHMAQLATAIDPYDDESLGLEAVSSRTAKREAGVMKTIAATHRGVQKVLNAAKMIGVG